MKSTYRNGVSMIMFAWILLGTLHAQKVQNINNLDASSKTAYFNLKTGKEVSDVSGAWDIAFNRTTILVNSGSSGNGNAMAVLLKDTPFEKVTTYPQAGFKVDTENEKAIPTGSGNGWYEYNMADHSINPIPNRILIIRTTSGDYVKLEILGYYSKSNNNSANYSFRYSFL